MSPQDTASGMPWAAIVPRFALFTGLWLILTEAATAGLVFGVLAAAAATWGSLYNAEGRWPVRPVAWLGFVPWFARQSLIGGWDVLLRALRPSLPLDPEWLELDMRVRTPAAQRLFAATVSLLPGTLTARIDGKRVHVHVLDRRRAVIADLQALEQRIGALFGERIASP